MTSASNDWNLWARTKNLLKPIVGNTDEKLVSEIIVTGPKIQERYINFTKAREFLWEKYDLFNSNEEENHEQFTQDELDTAFHHNEDVYNLMAHLNYCANESSSCPSCGEDLWDFSPGHASKSSPSTYFEKVSKTALSTLNFFTIEFSNCAIEQDVYWKHCRFQVTKTTRRF